MTKTTFKTTRKTHREPCCVCLARQAYLQAHAHARKCRKGTDTQECPEISPKAQRCPKTCVAGLAKSAESTPMLARIVPENKNVVPKNHSTNITPTSSRTAPQSYQKTPTSYICKPVSTNMVPTTHQKPRKQQEQPGDARAHLHEPIHVVP